MSHLYKLIITTALFFLAIIGVCAENTNIDKLDRVVQQLVAPPFLPEHEQSVTGDPKVVQIRMVIEEKLIDIDPAGTKIWAMTFNGSVPGPLIVVHQNDYVELTLLMHYHRSRHPLFR